GEMFAPFRLAAREGLLLAIVSVRQVIDAGEQVAELPAVVDDAADRRAAKARAVIAALAADQARAAALSVRIVERQRDLERGVDRLGARVRKEHMVEIARCEIGDARREREGLRVRVLERRRVIELRRRALDRLDDRRAIVAEIAAP